MKEDDFEIIWTPSYLPEVEPIELFWTEGKNYAMDQFINKRTTRDAVNDLHDGWYDNTYPASTVNGMTVQGPSWLRGRCDIIKNLINCAELVRKAIREANVIIGYTPSIQQFPSLSPTPLLTTLFALWLTLLAMIPSFPSSNCPWSMI